MHDRREAANSEISSPRDWIAETRARLDTELISRGGDELAIWQAIAEAQRFGVIVDAVERKIRALERLTNGLVDQAVVGEQPGVEARTEHALVRAAGRVGTADTLGADPPRDEAEPRSVGNIPPLVVVAFGHPRADEMREDLAVAR